MLSLWAIGLLGLLNQVEALWMPASYQSPAQQSSAQFSSSGWGGSPAAQNPWSFNRPMSNNMANMNAGGMPGSMPNGMPGSMPNGMPNGMPGSMPNGMPGSMPNGMPGSMPNGMPGSMPNGMPGIMPNGMPGSMPNGMPGSMPGGGAGYMQSTMTGAMQSNMMGNMQNSFLPPYMNRRNSICVAPVSQPRLCMVNGENTHKYRLKEVIEFLGDPNVEKVPGCSEGVPRVNCADYYAAQYIWKRGYCYCNAYHNNRRYQLMGQAPIRCVLNNCGACSQEFYVGNRRIVKCE